MDESFVSELNFSTNYQLSSFREKYLGIFRGDHYHLSISSKLQIYDTLFSIEIKKKSIHLIRVENSKIRGER